MASELWQRLRTVRKHLHISGEKLGAQLGVSKSAVSQWESPNPKIRTTPDLSRLQALSALYDVPLDWLLDDSSDLQREWWSDEEEAPLEPAAAPAHRIPSMAEVLDLITQELIDMPPARWPSIRAQLDQLVSHPEMKDDVITELLALFGGYRRKRQDAA